MALAIPLAHPAGRRETARLQFAGGRGGTARRGAGRVAASAGERTGERSGSDISRWSGRVAVVTGATSGIGRAIALRLAAEGVKVVGASRRASRLEELGEEVEAAGGTFLGVPTDMAVEPDIRSLFARTKEEWGGVDCLVNAAGVGKKAPLLDGSADAWASMCAVNIVGLSIATQEAVADMHAREVPEGSIIHIGSMSGHRIPGPGNTGFYGATKYAVRALTEGLRQELRLANSPVRATCISPGLVESEFSAVWSSVPEEEVESYSKERYGKYHVLQPGDVADAVLFALAAPPHMEVNDVLIRSAQDRGI